MSIVAAEVCINPVFQSFIAPLSKIELSHLEESILREGVRDPIVTWNGTILDGHHRYGICRKHKLPYRTHELALPDEEAAKLWMIENQLGRRNISAFYRCELVLAKESILRERGRAAMSAGGRESARARAERAARSSPDGERDKIQGLPNLANLRINTRGQLAFEACVSSAQLGKVKKVLQHGAPDVIASARHDDISIHQAYTAVRKALKPNSHEAKPLTEEDRYRKLRAAADAIYGALTPAERWAEITEHVKQLLESFNPNGPVNGQSHFGERDPEVT